MIDRPVYLKKLIDRKQNGLVKIITGVRRCGKSVLLFDLYFRHLVSEGVLDRQIVRIQLDNSEFAALRNPLKLSEYIKSRITDDQDYFIFIDEIQLVKKIRNKDVEDDYITFLDVLNGFVSRRNLDIYVTGSNSKMLSKDVLTEFRGRGDEVRVYPLSFREFCSAREDSKENALKDYMLYGGMPFILSRPSPESKISYLQNLFEETYIKDIVERNSIRNQGLLNSLTDEICSATGSLTSPTKLANTINSRYHSGKDEKVNNNTVASYLAHLENAFLFKEARRYDIRGKQFFNSNSKFYCVDVGLRNARLNMRQNEETHIMENVIFNDLLQRGYSVDVGVVEKFSKGPDGKSTRAVKEIDFVVNHGNALCYIQSAFRMDTPEKENAELSPFNIVGDSFKKIVVTRDELSPWYDDKGVYHIGLCDFLLKEDILG